jgi:hypothetical protein
LALATSSPASTAVAPASPVDPVYGLIETHRAADAAHLLALEEQSRLERMGGPSSDVAEDPCNTDMDLRGADPDGPDDFRRLGRLGGVSRRNPQQGCLDVRGSGGGSGCDPRRSARQRVGGVMTEHQLVTPRRNFLIRALGFTAAGATMSIRSSRLPTPKPESNITRGA